MNHVIVESSIVVDSVGDEPVPRAEMSVQEALTLVARHVAFVHAGQRTGRNRLALDLVEADIDRVLASAGMTRRVDDRGDDWAELDGRPMAWLGYRPEIGRLAINP
jgi:hypothetical protein